jgi:predicted DCC family thiol-disulfide oxidoreductase YuxK
MLRDGNARAALTMVASADRPLAAAELAALGSTADFVFRTDARPVILFDGVCTLCNGGVDFMLSWDRPNEARGAFRFAALQSEVGRALLARAGRQPNDISSIVVVYRDGRAYVKSEAVLRIGSQVGGGTLLEPFFPIASTLGLSLLPKALRDVAYDAVATNRYQLFGEIDECRLADDRFDDRFISGLAQV